MEEADLAKSWLWLRKGDLKGCTKTLISGFLGGVSKRLDRLLTKLGIAIKKGLLQKTSLLGTARILRKVLEN